MSAAENSDHHRLTMLALKYAQARREEAELREELGKAHNLAERLRKEAGRNPSIRHYCERGVLVPVMDCVVLVDDEGNLDDIVFYGPQQEESASVR